MCSASRRPSASRSRKRAVQLRRPPPMPSVPLPLAGRGQGWGAARRLRCWESPHPCPLPARGGRGIAGKRRKVVPDLAEAGLAAVGQDRIDGQHVVAHDAVADRARAAGVVAGHAADGGAARRSRRRPGTTGPAAWSCRFSSSSTMPGSTMQVRVDSSTATSRFRCLEVDDQRPADRLARLRGAAAARQQRHALLARDRQRRAHIVVGSRHHHAHRLDLVVRGVRGVAPAREAVEQHLALQRLAQAVGQGMIGGERNFIDASVARSSRCLSPGSSMPLALA